MRNADVDTYREDGDTCADLDEGLWECKKGGKGLVRVLAQSIDKYLRILGRVYSQ